MYLLDSGLTTGTVKNYRSAIAAIHPGFPDGSTVSDNGALSQLIKGMFVTRPPERKLVPSWDLFDVLSTLAGPPYEPMDCSTLLQLSVKLAFLLAVVTSRRRSELHALSVETGHIRWEPGGVRLVPTTGFLTKNQSSSFTLRAYGPSEAVCDDNTTLSAGVTVHHLTLDRDCIRSRLLGLL